jgi:hypothetical protein
MNELDIAHRKVISMVKFGHGDVHLGVVPSMGMRGFLLLTTWAGAVFSIMDIRDMNISAIGCSPSRQGIVANEGGGGKGNHGAV